MHFHVEIVRTLSAKLYSGKGVSGSTMKISALPEVDFCAEILAEITLGVFMNISEFSGKRWGISLNLWCEIVPVSRFTFNNLHSSRFSFGNIAMRSLGKSYLYILRSILGSMCIYP